MRTRFALLALAATAVLWQTAPLFADTVSFSFQASVDDTSGLSGWGSIGTGNSVMGTVSFDPDMPVSRVSDGRGEFWNRDYPISISLTIGSYAFSSHPSAIVGDSMILLQSGDSTEMDVFAFVDPNAWPAGLAARPEPGRVGLLGVQIYGNSSMISAYSSLPSSIDSSNIQRIRGWISPDFQSYDNTLWYSAGAQTSGSETPEPATLGVCGIGGALILISRLRMPKGRR
jgi:hypothetical protein